MPELEFTRYNGDFEAMKYENALYSTERYFPKNVTFEDAGSQKGQNLKAEIFSTYPESFESSQKRGVLLVKNINSEIVENAKGKNLPTICHLLITHGSMVDSLAHIFDIKEFLKSQGKKIVRELDVL